MRPRPLISADCSLTLYLCHQAGGRGGAVNHCHPAIGGVGGEFCVCLVTSCFLLMVTLPRLPAHLHCSGLRFCTPAETSDFWSDWTSAKLNTFAWADSGGVLKLSPFPLQLRCHQRWHWLWAWSVRGYMSVFASTDCSWGPFHSISKWSPADFVCLKC